MVLMLLLYLIRDCGILFIVITVDEFHKLLSMMTGLNFIKISINVIDKNKTANE